MALGIDTAEELEFRLGVCLRPDQFRDGTQMAKGNASLSLLPKADQVRTEDFSFQLWQGIGGLPEGGEFDVGVVLTDGLGVMAHKLLHDCWAYSRILHEACSCVAQAVEGEPTASTPAISSCSIGFLRMRTCRNDPNRSHQIKELVGEGPNPA